MLRLVLDTNVWLDWLVFADAAIAPIKVSVAASHAEIFIDAACADELASVLAYPLRKKILAADERAARMMECRRVTRVMEATAGLPPAYALPVCRDTDDQKFLELARACRADFLVTRDLLLLELMRRKIRLPPFRIVTPMELNAVLDATF